MNRRFTQLLMLFAAFLLTGSISLTAQTEVWNKTFTWNTTYNYRGIAYNPTTNHVLVAGTEGTHSGAGTTPQDNHVRILDAATGDLIKSISPATAMGGDWGYGIRDVEVDSEGGIYAMIVTTNHFNPVHIYYWENEDADPVMLWKDATGTDDDFGVSFSVNGALSDEALIIIPSCNAAYVYAIEAVDGVLGAATKVDLTGVGTVKTPNVLAFAPKIAAGFGYNTMDLPGPVKIDASGNIVATVPSSVFSNTVNSDAKMIETADTSVLVLSDDGDIILLNIKDKAEDLSDVTAADIISTVTGTAPVPSPGWPRIYGSGQEQAVAIAPNGDYAIYSLSGGNYVKGLADEAAPMASAAMLSGSPIAGEVKTAAYTYIDFNGDAEGTSEIKWYVSDDAAGTNKAEITAAAGATTYTLDAADAGKFISFTVMPVAATGTASDLLNTIESNMFGPVLAEETAPVADNVVITGELKVGSVLEASYDFSDAGGDLEGESIYQWYVADDAEGSNAVEAGSATLEYIVKPDDGGKYVIFSIIPVSATGWPMEGDEVKAATSDAILFPPMPPVAELLSISGREDVAAELSGSYTYIDLNGDAEEGSILKWYVADDSIGTNESMVAENISTYTLAGSDEGKIVVFEVTPVSVPTEGLDTGIVARTFTGLINPEPAEYPPVAKDVELTAVPEVGVLMSGSYVYFDTIVNDPEGASVYKWYTCDDAAGTNATLIDGADMQTYIVTEAELGKHFIFEVTPVAQSGGLLQGEAVQSAPTASAAVASTQTFGLERLWKGSVINSASPWYLNHTTTTERGMAVGTEHIYIASRTRVLIIDKADGSYVGELNMEGVEGGIYAVCDVEVSDDGQILGVPLIDGTDFWVWKWEDELSAPVKWLTHTPSSGMRLGDKFTVTGDLTTDAVIYAAKNEGNVLIKWTVTAGIPSAAEEIVLDAVGSLGTAPAVAPFSVSDDANILIDGKGFPPAVFDKDGNLIGSVDMIDNYAAHKIQSNSPNVFDYKGRKMAAFFQAMRKEPLGARIIVADVTAPPYQIVDSTEYVSNSMSWDGYLGEVDVIADAEHYYAYMLQAKHALASYRGQLELPEFTSAITNFEGDKVFTFFDKAMLEIEKTDAAPWTIMAGDAELAIDSIYNNEQGLSFDVATAITEGAAVTIAYDGSGSISSFNGLPLAAFGPESVENIVGSDVPVATDVVITGTAKPDEVLTGTYVFADPDGDLEGESTYQWWEATDVDGGSSLKLLGETAITYTVTADMVGKFVAFEVTPVSATGGDDYLVGDPVMSDYIFVSGVGIEKHSAGIVNAYPNPFSSRLTLENCTGFASVSIIEITGKIVKQEETMGMSTVELNLEDIQNGIYFLELKGLDGQSEVLRVIKTQ